MTTARRRKRPPPRSRPASPKSKLGVTAPGMDIARRDGALSLVAETLYVTTDISLARLAEIAPIKDSGTHVRTLESWCRDGKWVDHRQRFRERWKAKILTEIGSELVEARRQQLRQLDELQAQAMKQLAHRKLKPRSYEGMVNAICRLVLTVDHVRRGLMAEVAPAPTAGAGAFEAPASMRATLSEEEAVAAAKAVIALRQQRSSHPSPAPADE